MSRNRTMVATYAKPAVKQAPKKKPSTKGAVKGNAHKAAKKPSAKASMMNSVDAMNAFRNMSMVDTSAHNADVVLHTPKKGVHEGIECKELRLIGGSNKVKLSEGLARALARVFEANPSAWLEVVEYGRIVPPSY